MHDVITLYNLRCEIGWLYFKWVGDLSLVYLTKKCSLTLLVQILILRNKLPSFI